MMKFYKTAFLLLAFVFFGGAAFAQTPAPVRIVCYATPHPDGPLYVFVFKKKILYSMDSRLVGNMINPKLIKSINVEKGAKAAAIYGSRAANGVIVIEIDKKYARKEYKRLKGSLVRF